MLYNIHKSLVKNPKQCIFACRLYFDSFVDENGAWAIQPLFDSVCSFRGKYAKVVKNGTECYVDTDGYCFDEIPFFDKDEYGNRETCRSPKEILEDSFSKISGILHKGLHNLD